MESSIPCYVLYCLGLSIFSTIFMVINIKSVFAIVLISGYDYIKIDNQAQGGETCFWSAIIYMGFSILCLIYIKRKQRVNHRHQHLSTSSN